MSKKLLWARVSQLESTGMIVRPTPGVLTYPETQISLALPTTRSSLGTVAEVCLTNFSALCSNADALAYLSAHVGYKVKFALSSTGCIVLTKYMFDMGGESVFTGGAPVVLGEEDFVRLGKMLQNVLQWELRVDFNSAILFGSFEAAVSIAENTVMVMFHVYGETSADIWENTFQLKAAELTAASAYHNSLVGAAEQTTKEDIATERVLN